MFKNEGRFPVTITEATLTEPRFKPQNPGEQIYFDLALGVRADDGQTGYFYSECSNRPGRGNFAQYTQFDLTLQTLQKIGFNVADAEQFRQQCVADESGKISLPNLIGMKAEASVEMRTYERNGEEKTIYEVKYLNAPGGGLKRLDFAAFSQMNFGGKTAAAPAAPAAPAMPASNPFRK